MPKMPPGNKAKNPGSPQAAYERYTSQAQNKKRVLKKGTPKTNPGSPTAAAERQARSRAAGSPLAAAQRAGSRGRTAANTGKPKVNPGSPQAAYERNKRATTYGPTGGAQPTPSGRRAANTGKPKVNPGSPQAAYERNKRATTYGPTGGAQPRPERLPGGSRPKPNPGSPSDAAARAGSRGRIAANTGRPKVNPGSPSAAAERQAKSRGTAGGFKSASEREQFKQFGDYLAAKDVKGKGASAAAGRRRQGLADFVGRSGRKAANTGRPKALPKTK